MYMYTYGSEKAGINPQILALECTCIVMKVETTGLNTTIMAPVCTCILIIVEKDDSNPKLW